MFLLDTNVVSELRKASLGRADPNVVSWAAHAPLPSLFISVMTILELESGVLQMERRNPRQGARLRSWLENEVFGTFEGRILPFDVRISRQCAALSGPNRRPVLDSAIAATAMVHRLTVVTRNVRDFDSKRLPVLNPWEPQT